MAANEIELTRIRAAVNAVLDHIVEDLGIKAVAIEETEDFYWECPAPHAYDTSKKPTELDTGRLTDDVQFVNSIKRGQSGDVAYNLVHLASLLRYVGEKIKR